MKTKKILLLAIGASLAGFSVRADTCNSDGCTLDLNSSIYISNNQWGKGSSPSGYSQSITTSGSSSWRADFNWPAWGGGDGRDNQVKGYPAAILGWHWGWHFSQGATGLPRQLGSSYSASSSYNYSVDFGSGGMGDVAYDIWIHTSGDPGNSTPTDEVMIWVNSTGGANPYGSVAVSGINLEGGTWDLWTGQIPGAQYVWSFKRTSNSGSGTLNIKSFLDWLQSNRGLSSSKYLVGVEFGTEVFHGQGSLVANNYTCSVGSGSGPASGVTFYQDYNYGGSASQTLAPGSYTMSQLAAMGMPNDWASSVRVPSGYTVIMYADDYFSGTSWTLTADKSEFGSLGANDQVSSVVVQGGLNGTYKLIARHSGKAMDAAGYGTANGTQIQQWTYVGGANQKWTISSDGGAYKIIGVQSGKCVDIDGWGTANGSKVQLWDYLGGSNQKYSFTATDSGYYRITPTHATGSCLDVEGVSTADGALVHLWQWLGGSNQQWATQAP